MLLSCNLLISLGGLRHPALPLVTAGGESAGHDWFLIFSRLGLLPHDTLIAGVVRSLGWLGMLATITWLASFLWRRGLSGAEESTG